MAIHKLNPQTEVIADKQFMNSPELDKLYAQVKQDKKIELGPAEVDLFLVYPNISKKRPAKVIKCNREMKHYSGNDFILEFSGELWDMLDKETRYNLMWNTILHCNAEFKTKTQEWKFSISKPNYTDYYQISDKQGSEWHKAVQATASSLYDLDPKNEGQVSLF